MLRRLALVLALGLLTACSGEAETPGATLPPVTASPTPTAALPTPPLEADGEDNISAAAFARYYLEVVTIAFNRGDPGPLRALSNPGCEGCNNLIGALEQLSAEGRRVEGGDYVIRQAAAPADEVGDVVVDLNYEITAAQIVDAEGTAIEEQPAVPPADAQMRVVRESEDWKVFGYRIVEGA